MTKIEIISQKPAKNWIFGKKWPFFDTFWPKNPEYWIFPRITLLTHASRHLGEDFRKFSAKSNDKIQSYQQKNFKKWPFGPKTPILDPPGDLKGGENEFSGKKRKRHVLTFPKTKLHAKNQKFLWCGFPGKGGGERQKDRKRETDPNSRVLRTLSLSRRTKKLMNEY